MRVKKSVVFYVFFMVHLMTSVAQTVTSDGMTLNE